MQLVFSRQVNSGDADVPLSGLLPTDREFLLLVPDQAQDAEMDKLS